MKLNIPDFGLFEILFESSPLTLVNQENVIQLEISDFGLVAVASTPCASAQRLCPVWLAAGHGTTLIETTALLVRHEHAHLQ